MNHTLPANKSCTCQSDCPNENYLESVGKMAVAVRAKRYRLSAQRVFDYTKLKVLSVALDAGRVSGFDRLIAALYSPEHKVACWGDPVVQLVANGKS